MPTIRGAFDVRMTPADDGAAAAPPIGRMTLEKRYHGDLDATSRGQMLAVRTTVDGSAGYVAMEVVHGTLAGRQGSFALQHHGVMTRGARSLALIVVPDSGTGGLAGLNGAMRIEIDGGAHGYVFDYSLDEAAAG